jgi:hypothetical protein
MRRYTDPEVRDLLGEKLQYGHYWTSAYTKAEYPVPLTAAECEPKND